MSIQSFFLLFLLGMSQFVFAQKVSVLSSSYGGKLYPCVNNYIQLSSILTRGKVYTLVTNNGQIEEAKEKGAFLLRPDKIGILSLSIYTVVELDSTLIQTQKMMVHAWPLPRAHFGKITGRGSLSIPECKAQIGLCIPIEVFDMSGNFAVKYYEVALYRNGTLLQKVIQRQGRFNKSARKLLKEIKPEDQLLFTNIKINEIGGRGTTTLKNLYVDLIE